MFDTVFFSLLANMTILNTLIGATVLVIFLCIAVPVVIEVWTILQEHRNARMITQAVREGVIKVHSTKMLTNRSALEIVGRNLDMDKRDIWQLIQILGNEDAWDVKFNDCSFSSNDKALLIELLPETKQKLSDTGLLAFFKEKSFA